MFADVRKQTATKGDVTQTMLFDAGPEEEAWARNLSRLGADVSAVSLVQLSHWHRDHSGGLLEAIRTIKAQKAAKSVQNQGFTVDLHPSRPDLRGALLGPNFISMEADPTFDEITEAGGTVETHSEPHTVCDDFFLVSGEIPRVTPYEIGLANGMRYSQDTQKWTQDEAIKDERFVAINLKGKGLVVLTGCAHAGVVNTVKNAVELLPEVKLHAVMGGFHLSSSGKDMVEETIADLKKLGPKILLPGHCTGWRAKFEIERVMPGRLVPSVAGMKYTF